MESQRVPYQGLTGLLPGGYTNRGQPAHSRAIYYFRAGPALCVVESTAGAGNWGKCGDIVEIAPEQQVVTCPGTAPDVFRGIIYVPVHAACAGFLPDAGCQLFTMRSHGSAHWMRSGFYQSTWMATGVYETYPVPADTRYLVILTCSGKKFGFCYLLLTFAIP